MYFAGIDIGSTTTKIAILDDQGDRIIVELIGPTGAQHRHMANKVMEEALQKTGLKFEDISYIVATGYGRINVPFADKQITEISCHARGIEYLFPGARTVIDIGGQDCKGIKIKNGRVEDFVMNDKCAAGTGRYMEVVSEALDIPLEKLGEISFQATKAAQISSTCTVFAEQEVVSRIAEGTPLPDVVAGILEAIAKRVYRMIERIKFQSPVVFTGGGAKNVGLQKTFERLIGAPVLIPPDPQMTGAIGAAMLGKELTHAALKRGQEVKRGTRELKSATFFQ
ncbi:MAG: acyl-CoA dehydratase activase [Bacillota bacterium]